MPDKNAGSHRLKAAWFRPAYLIPALLVIVALLWFFGKSP